MKILCIGEALIDMICTNTGSTLRDGQDFLKKPGGAPTNVAAAIGALGGNVTISAKVGNDPFGEQLISTMRSFGVETEGLIKENNHFTTFAFVSLLASGERDFVFNRGADGYLNIEDLKKLDIQSYSIIHFGSATAFLPGPLQEAYLWLLQTALDNKIFISFDPNYRHLLFPNGTESFVKQSWHFLQHCNFFKLSDEEAMLLSATNSVQDAVELLIEKVDAVFAITLGKEGTMLIIDKQKIIIPSIPVQSVDSTGAGDAFVGAVLYQLSILQNIKELKTDDWKKIIQNGNKAGARTCEYHGAMEAFKHLNSGIFD